MKKTITITANDRPQYFEPMLQSLIRNNLAGWDIFVAIEPSSFLDAQINLVNKYIPDATKIVNEKKLGVAGNPYNLLTEVFTKQNSEFNIYLEEDIIVSPDICQLADWYASVEHESACLCLCNIGKIEVDEINNNSPHSCMFYGNSKMTHCGQGTGFSALGIFITKDSWFKNFEPFWFINQVWGWDWCVLRHLQATQQKIMLPYKTRSDHIGEWGTHVHGKKRNRQLLLGFLAVNQILVDPNSYWIFK